MQRSRCAWLYSADGNFTVKLMTKATVHSTGLVMWKPPAIYKSLCPIDVEFFPFDEQLCTLKIGSWTYDGFSVDIKHIALASEINDLEIIHKGNVASAILNCVDIMIERLQKRIIDTPGLNSP